MVCTNNKYRKSKGSVLNFLEKEDKWFGSIRGKSEAINDIDFKNFSVQGLGTIKNLKIEIPTYTITPGGVSLSSSSNTFNTSTITYSFPPASTNGSFAIAYYRVFISTNSQTPQEITNSVTGGLDHDPDTTYTITVSANDDPNDLNNTHEFYVVATDSNPIANQSASSTTNTITALALTQLSINNPSTSVASESPAQVIINLGFSNATGGLPPYTYTCTYLHSAMAQPADVVDLTGSTSLDPSITYTVDIQPTPIGPQDIAFLLTVTDSLGNTANGLSVINAGQLAPLSGSLTATISSTLTTISCFSINGTTPPSGGTWQVLVLDNLNLTTSAGGGLAPYELEAGFSTGSTSPYSNLQYIDYANSTTSYPGGPDYNNLVISDYPQTPSINVNIGSSNNFGDLGAGGEPIIVLNSDFSFSSPSIGTVQQINVELEIEDDDGNTVTETDIIDLLAEDPYIPGPNNNIYPFQ